MEQYRSGHNGADSKSVEPQGSVGSNPTCSARNYRSHEKQILMAFFVANRLSEDIVPL